MSYRNVERRNFITVLTFSLTCLFAAGGGALRAQNAQGNIVGHVSDPGGQAVVGAKVTVRNSGTNVTNTFTTNATGDYVVVNLIPANYEIAVEAQGFQTAQATGLIVQVEQTLRQDFTLTLGAVTQEVTVSSGGQIVQTDNATIGNVIPAELIEALPINGRDFTNLLSIAAGANNLSGGIQASGFVLHGLNPSFREVSLDGARPDSISYLVDGVTDNDFFFSAPSNIPPRSGNLWVVSNGFSETVGSGTGKASGRWNQTSAVVPLSRLHE
jgi:Carboxypeptidase regulatory-like domain